MLQLLLLSLLVQGISQTSAMATAVPKFFVGFDLGTSGARISIVENNSNKIKINCNIKDDEDDHNDLPQYNEVHSDSVQYSSYDDPKSWLLAIESLLQNSPSYLLQATKAICVSGTSASCLLVDTHTGKVTRQPKMYDYDITHSRTNDGDKIDPTAHIKTKHLIDKFAPNEHATRASTSALSKLIHYHYCNNLSKNEVLAHQSEYVASTLFLSDPMKCGAGYLNNRDYVSDWHNALKLGYDVKRLCYPEWLIDCLNNTGIDPNVLPRVVAPGQNIGTISSTASKTFGIHPDAVVVGGTTDSNAAFIAATATDGIPTYGTAVTSLGSTLAIKILSRSFVENSSQGVYSHRFPSFKKGKSSSVEDNSEEELWLVGGASNVGCAILRQENFSNEELVELSKDMDVMINSPIIYYPLTKRGERFPVADGSKEPVLTPKPESRMEYLKAILQGISLVEQQAFEVLGSLGADPTYPNIVWTCGGGSKNDKWIKMRQRMLQNRVNGDISDVKVMKATNSEASFGAAVLAASSFI